MKKSQKCFTIQKMSPTQEKKSLLFWTLWIEKPRPLNFVSFSGLEKLKQKWEVKQNWLKQNSVGVECLIFYYFDKVLLLGWFLLWAPPLQEFSEILPRRTNLLRKIPEFCFKQNPALKFQKSRVKFEWWLFFLSRKSDF